MGVSRRVYTELVAGSLASEGGQAEAIAYRAASRATSSESLLLDYVEVAGQVYYLAVKASQAADELIPATPLSSALPGRPAYKGPGIYTVSLQSSVAALIILPNVLRLYVNELGAIQRAAEELAGGPLNVYSVDDVAPEFELQSLNLAAREYARKKVAQFSGLLLGVGFFCSVVGIGAFAAKTSFVYQTPPAVDMNGTIQKAVTGIRTAHPMTESLVNLQKISYVITVSGGWLQEYTVNGNVVHFKAQLPAWVTMDDAKLRLLGPKAVVKVNRNPADPSTIIVER